MRHIIKAISLSWLLCLSIQSQAAIEIECDCECLAGFMDTFLESLVNHDSASLPVTRNVKYTENGTVTSNDPNTEKGSMVWMDCKAQLDIGFSVIVTDIRQIEAVLTTVPYQMESGW